MATSRFFWSRYGDFFLILKIPSVGFTNPFFCRQVTKIRQKKKKKTNPNKLLDFLPNGYQFNQLSKSQELIGRLLTYKCQGGANWFAMSAHHLTPTNPKKSFMHVMLSCQT